MASKQTNKDGADIAEESSSIKNAKPTSIGTFASVEELSKNGLGEIVAATKTVNSYPQGSARDLYCAYPTFGKIIDVQSDRILGIISKVLKWQNVKGNIQRRQPDEQFEMLLECNDAIFERLGTNLDEMAGIKKNPQTIVIESRLNTVASTDGAGSWNLKKNEPRPLEARLITAKNIARPQIKFQIPVDNSAAKPFVPQLVDKPNSLKPLAILPEYDDADNIVSYLHPYEFELMKFEVPKEQLLRKTPLRPADLHASSDFMYVDTKQKLKEALVELRQHNEIAVDVEHHSYRTFLGFTCLVQISTRKKDYLFDALELRGEMHILNDIFTDPRVVKIFHGAEMDVEWLQRDLSLYIVNMFDTHQAAKTLNFARLSLAYLLKHYCEIEADKTFQLADWRIRPLPDQLISYARQDTHFLIYIFECITNDLLDAANQKTNLLRNIYQRSTELCSKRYVKPTITTDSHMELFRKSKRIFDNRQLYALREIFKWRDTIARQEDESCGYVLPNHMMLQIAESLPREMQGILACCNPIPPLVRQHVHTLHQIILRAREQLLVKPILETDPIHRVAITNVTDYNSKLYCPHDLSHCEEFRDDLPTLLNFKNSTISPPTVLQAVDVKLCKPVLSIFDAPEQPEVNDHEKENKIIVGQMQIISPYQRYLAVLPLAEKEKLEEAARIEAENKKRRLCPTEPSLPIKREVVDDDNVPAQTESDEMDMYRLPIKELLKRKYEESVANKITSNAKRFKTTTPTDDKLKFVNFPPSEKGAKNQTISAATTAILKKSSKTESNTNEVHNEDSSNSDAPPDEMPSTSCAHLQQSQTNNFKQNKKRNKKNKFKSNKIYQSSDKPVHADFDYQSVDFKKFQGGAQRAKGTELKPQFLGKNNTNKAKNKKFNKLFTFSKVKGNKK